MRMPWSATVAATTTVLLVGGTVALLAPTALARNGIGSVVHAKKGKPTATVDVTWTIRRSYDTQPENWEEVKITAKKAVATMRTPINAADQTFEGSGPVTIEYKGRYYTDDRSWHAGCDVEERNSTVTWSGDLGFYVFETTERTEHGKHPKFNGWEVEFSQPKRMRPTTTGSYQDWESILMDNCQTFPITTPMGGWMGPYFPNSYSATGRLNSDHQGVLLTQVHSAANDTYTIDGHIKFSAPVKP